MLSAKLKMKNKTSLPAILALALALLATSRLTPSAAETKPSQGSAALEKAKKIQLPDVKFDGLPLAEVITMLHNQSIKCDTDHKGVKIALGPNAKQHAGAKINVDLKDVSLAEVVERVAESIDLKVEATDTELLLVPKKE
jgi:hypothetical protein